MIRPCTLLTVLINRVQRKDGADKIEMEKAFQGVGGVQGIGGVDAEMRTASFMRTKSCPSGASREGEGGAPAIGWCFPTSDHRAPRYLRGCVLSQACAIAAGTGAWRWAWQGSRSPCPRGTSRNGKKSKFASTANPAMFPALSMETTNES